MKLAISELEGELGLKRYIEKQRISQTIEIICGPSKLGRILSEMANGPTQATLCGLEMPKDANYAAVIQYLADYLLKIEDFAPEAMPNYGK